VGGLDEVLARISARSVRRVCPPPIRVGDEGIGVIAPFVPARASRDATADFRGGDRVPSKILGKILGMTLGMTLG